MRTLICFSLLLLLACTNNEPGNSGSQPRFPQARGLDWLAGAWRIVPPDSSMTRGDLIEEWKRETDSSFSGRSYLVSGPDTTLFERILLVENGPHLLYIASVPGQNNNEPVSFQRVDTGGRSFTFVNAGHDFPQRIRYERLGADSLLAEIEGPGPAGTRREQFRMGRMR